MDLAASLRPALSRARDELTTAASIAARSQTPLGVPVSDRAMASLAQSAIFSEAVLAAMHSRLEEFKTVTK